MMRLIKTIKVITAIAFGAAIAVLYRDVQNMKEIIVYQQRVIDTLHQTTITHNWVLDQIIERINNSYTALNHYDGTSI